MPKKSKLDILANIDKELGIKMYQKEQLEIEKISYMIETVIRVNLGKKKKFKPLMMVIDTYNKMLKDLENECDSLYCQYENKTKEED